MGGKDFEGVHLFLASHRWGPLFWRKKFEKARETHFSRVSVKNKTKDKDFLGEGGGHLFLEASKIKSPPPPCP